MTDGTKCHANNFAHCDSINTAQNSSRLHTARDYCMETMSKINNKCNYQKQLLQLHTLNALTVPTNTIRVGLVIAKTAKHCCSKLLAAEVT